MFSPLPSTIHVPSLVRIKPGALDRLGIYLKRAALANVQVLASPLPGPVLEKARSALASEGLDDTGWLEVDSNSFENAAQLFSGISKKVEAVIGIGGGKALDTAKYLAFLAGIPYLAVPTSLTNDGFCSPQASLTIQGNRRSLPAAMPRGVIIDVDVCLGAPKLLWLSGVGDLVSKITAVADWKLAFHKVGEPVNDLAALLSDATVRQFLACPSFDKNGAAQLATGLLLNGIAMEICGSSRPASGSEHLISHALDAISERPRLHGIQVGLATYLISLLQQGGQSEIIGALYDQTGFWDAVREDPFSRREWLEAARMAPSIKEDFYTILSEGNPVQAVEKIIDTDPRLQGCFSD